MLPSGSHTACVSSKSICATVGELGSSRCITTAEDPTYASLMHLNGKPLLLAGRKSLDTSDLLSEKSTNSENLLSLSLPAEAKFLTFMDAKAAGWPIGDCTNIVNAAKEYNTLRQARSLGVSEAVSQGVFPFVKEEDANELHVKWGFEDGKFSGQNYLISNLYRFIFAFTLDLTDPKAPLQRGYWERFNPIFVSKFLNDPLTGPIMQEDLVTGVILPNGPIFPLREEGREREPYCDLMLNLPSGYPFSENDIEHFSRVDTLCGRMGCFPIGSLTRFALQRWGLLAQDPAGLTLVHIPSAPSPQNEGVEATSATSEDSLDSDVWQNLELIEVEKLNPLNLPWRRGLPARGFHSPLFRATSCITFDTPEYETLNALVRKLLTKVAVLLSTDPSSFSRKQLRYTVHLIVHNFDPLGESAYSGVWSRRTLTACSKGSTYRYNNELKKLKSITKLNRSTERYR